MGNTRLNVIELKKEFLRLFREEFTITNTCKRMNISRRLYYYWCKADPEFVRAMDLAREDVADTLEAEALRRVYEGIEEDIYFQNTLVGKKREYSDTLLILLLRGMRRWKYRGYPGFKPDTGDNFIINIIPPKESCVGTSPEPDSLPPGEKPQAPKKR
jgi:hypothetical protein